jgi:hypothetical protein
MQAAAFVPEVGAPICWPRRVNQLLPLTFIVDPRSALRFGMAFALHQNRGEERAAGGMQSQPRPGFKPLEVVHMIPRFVVAVVAVIALTAGQAFAARPVLRISILMSGVVLVNGERTMLPLLEPELVALKARGGEVWYFRESTQTYPGRNGLTLFGLLIKHRVPTSLSDRADFSDLEQRETAGLEAER